MVRKSEVFVEYEAGGEMPLSWARALAADLRCGGLYRSVKVSKSRAGESAVAMGRVWVDQSSSRATGIVATADMAARPVAAEPNVGKDSNDKEVV